LRRKAQKKTKGKKRPGHEGSLSKNVGNKTGDKVKTAPKRETRGGGGERTNKEDPASNQK